MWRNCIVGLVMLMNVYCTQGQIIEWDYFNNESNRLLDFTWANDITNKTDYYYTNGFEINYTHQRLNDNPLSKIMVQLPKATSAISGIGFKHDIFTPILQVDSLVEGDRPFSSYGILNYRQAFINQDIGLCLLSEIGVGVIGKYAFGQEVQNGFHSILAKSDAIQGWNRQIGSSPLIYYRIRLEKQLAKWRYATVHNWVDARLGLPYTDAAVGMTFQVGIIPNNLMVIKSSGHKRIFVLFFAKPQLRFIGYNATLQGGIIRRDSFYNLQSIRRLVPEMEMGINIQYQKYRLTAGQHFTGKEFSTAKTHQWGYLKFSIAF